MAQDVHRPPTPASDDRPPPRPDAGVEVSYTGDRPTVAVTGRVDGDRVAEVSGTVRGLLAVGVEELVVDLTHAWDGAALLTVLARARAELADRGGTLLLVGVALPEFLAALRTAPLDEVFLVHEAVRRHAEDTPTRRRTRATPAAPEPTVR